MTQTTAQKKLLATGIALMGLTLAACGSGADTDTQAPTSEANAPSSSAPHPRPTVPEGMESPGAMVGNDQRTWPDPAGRIDDSAHAEPGTTSVDMLGRPVWTPVNHEGDLPAAEDLTEGGFEQCANPATIGLQGTNQIQYVNARYLVVNDQNGPTAMNSAIPTGYAHSPQGAIMAAINQSGYGIYGNGDGVGFEAFEQLWQSSESAKDDWQVAGYADSEPSEIERALTVLAPEGVRVQNCTDDAVVVEILSASASAEDQFVVRIPMIWDGKNWNADLRGPADAQMMRAATEGEDFHEVSYQ